MANPDIEGHAAPVLIAGGGLIGLSCAMFLAQHGIRSLAVERLKETSPLPRAAFFHMRTLEMFRAAGIEARVREESERDFVPEGAIILMDSIAGKKLADIIGNLNEDVSQVSPCRRLFLNQPHLEPILAERARHAGARILTGHEVAGLAQDAKGVSLTVRDTGTGIERELRGQYLVGADGAHSRVRELLGIGMDGRGVFSNSMTIYFTADLSPWLGGKPISLVYVKNAAISGFFRMNRAQTAGFLAINTVGDPDEDPVAAADAAADTSEDRLRELLHAGFGASIPVRIDGVARWRATADVATRYRDGRIFIAGDAAHLMPPNGGFGGNTGIHDAHNLAWKLAAVLKGQAGDGLLDTYESERHPVGRFTVEQAFARFVTRTAPWLQASQQIDPIAEDFDIEIGYRYQSSAISGSDPDAPLHGDPRNSHGAPGSRMPHLWIRRHGKRMSTLDLGSGYLMLAGAHGQSWMGHAASASRELSVPLEILQAGRDFEDPDDAFPSAFGVSAEGATLVRPDAFVAWRAAGPPPRDGAASLRSVLERHLSRQK